VLFSIIAGIITGYVVSIPPLGPISFALISKGFNNRVKEGLSIASGAAFMDFVYCMVAFGGISLIISLLPAAVGEFYRENINAIQVLLTYTGCIIVIIYGIRIMRTKTTFIQMEEKQAEKIHQVEERAKVLEEKVEMATEHIPPLKGVREMMHHGPVPEKGNHGGLFLLGVLLCISSITLPASWIAFVGYLKGYRIIESSFLSGLVFSIGAAFGTLFWFYTLLRLITGQRHRINPGTIGKLNLSAGVILIILGIFLFGKATLSLL
jgi:threonine/homoserine/homoserine lactone efflux protein